MNISVIIPVYKNKYQFLQNLKNNLEYLNNEEIIIINDDPSVSLQKKLAKIFNIILIENKTNLGFGQSVNIGVSKSTNNFILLLNTDVVLHDQNYKLSLDHFKNNKSLFAVAFAQKEKNDLNVGKNIIYWENGFLRHKKADNQSFGYSAWAEGGSCLFDKKKFELLGGFDPIYKPFYWEDVDLGYRAWKAGYQIIFDPKILVEHQHESTIRKYFSQKFIRQISFRNQLIFIWKNIKDGSLLRDHVKNLVLLTLTSLLKGNFIFIRSLTAALIKMTSFKTVKKSVRSDIDILNIF